MRKYVYRLANGGFMSLSIKRPRHLCVGITESFMLVEKAEKMVQ